MKFLYDYFPIICFFVAYKIYGIYVATTVTMIASALQVGVYWLWARRFEKIHLITLALVLLLGGSTLFFHNELFIKWKPSVIYWAFSIALIVSQYFGKKNLIHRMLGEKIDMPLPIWTQLNFIWAVFFLFLGGLNLYVVYHFSTNAWVNFKLFGTLGLTLAFIVAQVFYIAKHIKHKESS